MSHLQQNMPSMMALAYQRTDEAKVQLAGMLADTLLLEGKNLSLREQELVNELLDQLMQYNTPAVRAKLVEKFVDATHMPRKVVLSLMGEPIDTVRNILAQAISLTDDDLIQVIDNQGRDHARAVAHRQNISEAVADALVLTGDLQIMQMVASNLGARLTPKAVEIVSDAARFTAALREPIMHRAEMTTDAATKLYWWVSQDLRRYAVKRFGIHSGQIDEALSKTVDQLLSYHVMDRTDDDAMQQVCDWLVERQAVSAKILPQVLRLGHYRLFNIMLAYLTRLTPSLIDTIVSQIGGRGLAVICRSIGIDKTGFVSLFLLSRGARPGEQVVHPRELSYALASFDRLSIDLAQDLLHSWKQDPSYLTRDNQQDVVLEG